MDELRWSASLAITFSLDLSVTFGQPEAKFDRISPGEYSASAQITITLDINAVFALPTTRTIGQVRTFVDF